MYTMGAFFVTSYWNFYKRYTKAGTKKNMNEKKNENILKSGKQWILKRIKYQNIHRKIAKEK